MLHAGGLVTLLAFLALMLLGSGCLSFAVGALLIGRLVTSLTILMTIALFVLFHFNLLTLVCCIFFLFSHRRLGHHCACCKYYSNERQ